MSDYIRKSALEKYMRDYKWEFALGSDFSKAMEMVDVQPTLDEKEIIRKSFERVVERLEEAKRIAFLTLANTGNKMKDIVYDEVMAYLNTAIEIVKEECGINE